MDSNSSLENDTYSVNNVHVMNSPRFTINDALVDDSVTTYVDDPMATLVNTSSIMGSAHKRYNEDNLSKKKEKSLCPIINTRREIKGAHWYEKPDNLITVYREIHGSADTPVQKCEMSYGNMCFYMSVQKMHLARFELGKPSLNDCIKYLGKIDYIGKDYRYIYKKLLKSVDHSQLYKAFIKTYNMLMEAEKLLVSFLSLRSNASNVSNVSKGISNVSISIPTLQLDAMSDMMIMYDPNILKETVDGLVEFTNKINVDSVVKNKPKKIVNSALCPKDISMDKKIVYNLKDKLTVESALILIKELLDQEMEVAEYLYVVERFHADEINTMNEIQATIAMITSELI